MDEVELAQKNQKQFQENLVREQQEFLEKDIEESRERDRLAGIEAQKRLREEVEDESVRREYIAKANQEEDYQNELLIQQQQEESEWSFQQQDVQSDTQNTDKQKNSQKPPFPFIMFGAALLKDLFDLVLTLTGVGVILVEVYSWIYDAICFLWAKGRLSKIQVSQEKKDAYWKKFLIRFFTMVGISIVPVLDVLPEATVMVIRNYKAEVELAKKSK